MIIKKISFLLVGLFSTSLFAQTEDPKQTSEYLNVGSFSPGSLWHGVRVKYERVLTPKFTAGGILTGYYGLFPGVQLAPIGRYYFKANAPEGFYGQAKVLAGYHAYESKSFVSFGGGVAAGYQLIWGKSNRWTIDINLGLRFVPNNVPNVDKGNHIDEALKQGGETISWTLWGLAQSLTAYFQSDTDSKI
jgi:hypothetical protein